MKKNLFFMALAFSCAFALTSCGNDDEVSPDDPSVPVVPGNDAVAITVTQSPSEKEGEYVGGGLVFSVISETDKTVRVNGLSEDNNDASFNGNLTIPSYINFSGTKYTVTEIRDKAFYELGEYEDASNRPILKSVIMPNTLLKIGEYTFEHCNCLTSVVLAKSLKEIGRCAFQITNLKSIDIPATVTILCFL